MVMYMDSKYLAIYSDIVEKIDKKILKNQEKLPSENELMAAYDVSRDTIRKALDLLSQEGYIQKIKGKGSFVLDIHRFDFPISGLTSFKELASKMNGSVSTDVVTFEKIPAEQGIAKHLGLKKGDKVWKIIRVREIDGERIILDKDYIIGDYIEGLTEAICKDSIYEYLENQLGLKIGFAKKVVTVEKRTPEDEALLEMSGFDMIAVVRNYTYLEDATLFQYTESRHRPDRFRFVDFARRK